MKDITYGCRRIYWQVFGRGFDSHRLHSCRYRLKRCVINAFFLFIIFSENLHKSVFQVLQFFFRVVDLYWRILLMKLYVQFMIILIFSLIGEAISTLLHLPVPGSIIGLVLLFLALEFKNHSFKTY